MLPYPVTFVCKLPDGYPNLFQDLENEPPHPDSLEPYLGAEVNWVLRTYLILKRKKLNVFLAPKLIPGKICVVAPYKLRARDYGFDCFTVGCRADFARPVMCDIAIVQNKASVKSERDLFIPHWPQLGLMPRLRERGSRVENMVFKGRSFNLHHKFRSPEFLAQLAGLGVRFESHDELISPIPDWSDYRTCDVILAVRDLTEQDALVKPASKLVNAWIAGVPAILGPEPAYRELRKSSLDFLEVKTPPGVLDVIRRFKLHSEYYEQIVANGLQRAEEFSEDMIARKWVDALAGPVAECYGRWLKSSSLLRLAKFPIKSIRKKLADRAAVHHRSHGYRIISNNFT